MGVCIETNYGKLMENIIDNIDGLIDDIERDKSLTKTEIVAVLYKIKEELEQYKLQEEEDSLDWDDFDNY